MGAPLVKDPKAQVETQSEKFVKAARDLGCDEDEARFEDALRKVAKHKLQEEPKVNSSPPRPDAKDT